MAGWQLAGNELSEPAKKTLEKTIMLAKQSNYVDVVLRLNGEDVYFQADWIKYLEPTNKD